MSLSAAVSTPRSPSAPGGTNRPPWWYFALSLVVVPALWLPAALALTTVMAAGPGGATLAFAVTGLLFVTSIVWLGAARGFDNRWVLAGTISTVVTGFLWAAAEVFAFWAIECGGQSCFN